jgi:hypothetical protein
MVEEGDLRIGTLFGYKSFEQHGGSIYDAEEGVRRLGVVDIANVVEDKQEVELLKHAGIFIEDSAHIVISNFSNQSNDRYIYSFSSELSDRCAAACHEDYDAVVIIWNLKELITKISGKVHDARGLVRVAPVTYTKELPIRMVEDVPPEFVKLPSSSCKTNIGRFGYQNPFRFSHSVSMSDR